MLVAGQNRSLYRQVASLLTDAIIAVGRRDASAVDVQQHPLGFLCVKWRIDTDKSLRLHVWDRDMKFRQEPNWPIHDHVFSFKSAVLFGKVQNKLYALSGQGAGRSCEIYEVDYAQEQSRLVRVGRPARLTVKSSIVYEQGEAYEMKSGILHRTALRSPFAVTVLATNAVQSQEQRPRVIGDRGWLALTYSRGIAQTEEVLAWLERARELLPAS